MRFRHLVLSTALAATAPAFAFAAGPRYAPWGLELKDMDRSVKPGDGFFQYAEGTWLKTHPIPADKSRAGYNYEMPDEIEQQVMVRGRVLLRKVVQYVVDAQASAEWKLAGVADAAGVPRTGPSGGTPGLWSRSSGRW